MNVSAQTRGLERPGTVNAAPELGDVDGRLGASRTPLVVCDALWKVYGNNKAINPILANAAPSAEKYARLKELGAVVAAADVSFTVLKGEILMIMGLSGSGKSTVLRCLSWLVEPTKGEIAFDGFNLSKMGRSQLIETRRKKIGMVFQNFGLQPHLTVLDNIAFPLRVQGVPRAERLARAQELAELVQLTGRESFYPHQISGGQQQRVGIARSLATDPDLWLLDEPFSALDPLIRRQMQNEFLRLQAQLNKTIVFVTHDFAEAARLADRIAIMRDGRLVQIGSPAELITRPADDYVRGFAAEVSILDVICAGHIAVPAQVEACEGAPRVAKDTPLRDLLPLFLDGAGQVIVENRQGHSIGSIDRDEFRRSVLSASRGDA